MCLSDADPDPTFHFDADPHPDPAYHFDADTDPAYQFDADPDPDCTFIGSNGNSVKTLENSARKGKGTKVPKKPGPRNPLCLGSGPRLDPDIYITG